MSASRRIRVNSRPVLPDFAASALEYFDARCEAFREAADLTRRYHAVEGIHQLRVETKKLRAFLQVVGEISTDKVPRRHARHLRQLFGVAGQARDLDIQQGFVAKGLRRLELSEFFNSLKEKELLVRPDLQDALVKDVFLELKAIRRYVRDCVTQVTPDVGRRRVAEAVLHMALELRAKGSGRRLERSQLHDVRKLAKSTRYGLDLLTVVTGNLRPVASAVTRLKVVYNHLGDWRDTEITLHELEAFLKESRSEPLYDRKAYATLAADLKARGARNLQQFKRAWVSLRPTLVKLPDILHSSRLAGGD